MNFTGAIPEDLEQFCREREEAASGNRRRLSFFLQTVTELERENIPVLPLKGLDLLIRAYTSPSQRPMADMDLLIRRQDVRKVMRYFESKGFTRKPDEGLTYLSPDKKLNLDILWEFWYLPARGHKSLWNRTVQRLYEGRSIRCLHPEDLLIYHLAYMTAHRGSLSPQLKQDLEFFLETEGGNLDWAAINAAAGRLGIRPAVYHSLRYAGAEQAAQLQPRGLRENLQARLYSRLVTEKPRLHVSYAFTWLEYPGLRGKFKLLREKLLPSRFEFEIHRGSSRLSDYLCFLVFHPFQILLRAMRQNP